MFRFIKRVFVAATSFFSCNVLECVSMSDQKRKLRPEIINIKSNESSFYPYSVKKKSKYKGSCNNIYDLYATLCVPDVVKNISVTVFNLIS